MHEELESVRTLSFNVRKRNRKSARKLLELVGDRFQQRVVALQEAQRWTSGSTKNGVFFGK